MKFLGGLIPSTYYSARKIRATNFRSKQTKKKVKGEVEISYWNHLSLATLILIFNKTSLCEAAFYTTKKRSSYFQSDDPFVWIMPLTESLPYDLKNKEWFDSFKIAINPIYATGLFRTPWKHQKISGFLMFSRGIERQVAWNGCYKTIKPFLTFQIICKAFQCIPFQGV